MSKMCTECGYEPMQPYPYKPKEFVDDKPVSKYRCPICGYLHNTLEDKKNESEKP